MLELDFLREVDARGDLYTKEVVHRAVYRFDNADHLVSHLMIMALGSNIMVRSLKASW